MVEDGDDHLARVACVEVHLVPHTNREAAACALSAHEDAPFVEGERAFAEVRDDVIDDVPVPGPYDPRLLLHVRTRSTVP